MNATLMTMVLVAVVGGVSFAARPPATRGSGDFPPMLTVSGEAEAAAKPDLAIIRIGTEKQANPAEKAQAEVNEVMTAATAAVREKGIAEEDIQTSGLNLWPIYAGPRPGQPVRNEEEQRLVGYRASNVLEIRVKDLSKVGPVIDAAIGAGANRLESVSFSLENDLEARNEALASAAKKARSKAEALAEAMGVRIEGVVEIVEGGVRLYPPQPMGRMRGLAMAAEAMSDTPVQPGQVRVQASVTVTYRVSEKG